QDGRRLGLGPERRARGRARILPRLARRGGGAGRERRGRRRCFPQPGASLGRNGLGLGRQYPWPIGRRYHRPAQQPPPSHGPRPRGGGGSRTWRLTADGTGGAWGADWRGELGEGPPSPRATPVEVAGLAGAIAVAAGASYSLALANDGTVWAWGDNTYGQVGDG